MTLLILKVLCAAWSLTIVAFGFHIGRQVVTSWLGERRERRLYGRRITPETLARDRADVAKAYARWFPGGAR